MLQIIAALEYWRPLTFSLEDVAGFMHALVPLHGKLQTKKGVAAAAAAAAAVGGVSAAGGAAAADGSASSDEEEEEEEEEGAEEDGGAGSVTGNGASKEKVAVRCWLRLVPQLFQMGYQV